jgi:hypothetical protein
MSVDFISPTDVLGTTTAFFGGTIDLDPASNEFANTVVGADKYFNFIDVNDVIRLRSFKYFDR